MSNLTGLEEAALRLYGLSQADIDTLDVAIPAAERMVALVNRAQPLIDEALTLNAKAQPLLEQANAELKLIIPAALALRTFLQKRQEASVQPSTLGYGDAGNA